MIARLLVILSLVLLVGAGRDRVAEAGAIDEVAEIVEVPDLEMQLPVRVLATAARSIAAPRANRDHAMPLSWILPSVFRPPRSAFV